MAIRRWWKCKIKSEDEGQLEFKKGDLVFARNGESDITLFDGKRWVSLPRRAVTKIKLLSRLSENEAAFVERYYQFKLGRASHSSVAGAPVMLGGQDAQKPCESRIDEPLAVSLEKTDKSPIHQTLGGVIPIDALYGKEARGGW